MEGGKGEGTEEKYIRRSLRTVIQFLFFFGEAGGPTFIIGRIRCLPSRTNIHTLFPEYLARNRRIVGGTFSREGIYGDRNIGRSIKMRACAVSLVDGVSQGRMSINNNINLLTYVMQSPGNFIQARSIQVHTCIFIDKKSLCLNMYKNIFKLLFFYILPAIFKFII